MSFIFCQNKLRFLSLVATCSEINMQPGVLKTITFYKYNAQIHVEAEF